MKKLLFFTLSVVMGLTACKEDELTVTIVENGNLTLTFVDNNGNFISDAEVTLYQNETELEEVFTDENGQVNFGTLNVGPYNIEVEAEVNDRKYEFYRAVQVVAGANKQYEINVESFVGDMSVQFRNGNTGENVSFSGLNTAVVTYEDYENLSGLEALLNAAVDTQTTDDEGNALYEGLPVGRYYVIYYKDDNFIDANGSYYIEKNETDYVTFYVNVTSLTLENKASWNIVSVVDEQGNNVANDYETIVFDMVNSDITLTRSNGLSDVTGDFGYGSSYITFYWDSISTWYTDIESISQNEIVISYYDYNLGEDVIMTLN